MAYILVDERSHEDTYQLQITMEVISENYIYFLEAQPLYETEGDDPEVDLKSINKFIDRAKDVAKEFVMPCEVSSMIWADIQELKELMITGKE